MQLVAPQILCGGKRFRSLARSDGNHLALGLTHTFGASRFVLYKVSTEDPILAIFAPLDSASVLNDRLTNRKREILRARLLAIDRVGTVQVIQSFLDC